MKIDEMKDEYDFSNGVRGMFRRSIGEKKSNLPKTSGLAVCIASDNEKLLQKRKIYNAVFIGDEIVEVTNEKGEKAIYSAKCFLRIELPLEIKNVLEKITV